MSAPSASRPGGSSPRSRSAWTAASGAAPPSTLAEDAVADLPRVEGIQGDRDRVLGLLGRQWRRDVEPGPQERPHGMGEEGLQVGQVDVGGALAQAADQRAAAGPAHAPHGRRLAPASADASKLNGRSVEDLPGYVVARIEGLQRVPDDDAVADRLVTVVSASSASSSSPSGTAGGRSAPVCSLAPV